MSKRTKKTPSYLVDTIIVTGGRWDYLKECLDALKNQPTNVILIDNASPMDERIQNSELFLETRTKRIQQSVSFAEANNEGARMGSAPFILFLNDDCILQDGAIATMLDTLQKPDVGIVGAKLTFPLTSTSPQRPAGKVQHVGLALNIRGEVIHPLVGWSADNPRACQTREVWGVTGACLMVRRQLFSKIAGFDPAYVGGTYEDADLCLRVRAMGYRIILNAQARGSHYTGATAEKKRVAFPIQMNSLTFKSKWLNSPLMAWGTPDGTWVGEAGYW